jgi:hypothetical protein
MRKPRSDSKIYQLLTTDQQAQVANWLSSGGSKSSYDAVQKKIAKEFRIKISTASLSAFWSQTCSARLTERLSHAAEMATTFAKEAENSGTSFDAATIALIRQRAFELAAADKADFKKLFLMLQTFLKAHKQGLEERKVKLLERKASIADKAEATLKDEKLSKEERDQRLKQIFGLT